MGSGKVEVGCLTRYLPVPVDFCKLVAELRLPRTTNAVHHESQLFVYRLIICRRKECLLKLAQHILPAGIERTDS